MDNDQFHSLRQQQFVRGRMIQNRAGMMPIHCLQTDVSLCLWRKGQKAHDVSCPWQKCTPPYHAQGHAGTPRSPEQVPSAAQKGAKPGVETALPVPALGEMPYLVHSRQIEGDATGAQQPPER